MTTDPWAAAAQHVPAAVAGDRDALGALIGLTQRDVRRFVASLAGAGEADDLTQDTYLRAIKALPRFEQRSSLRTWLLVIARRTVVDHLRRRATRPHLVDGADWVAAADAAGPPSRERAQGDPATGAELRDLLERLPADRREALVLTQVLGLSYAEVAQVCGCPIGTVRSRVARGRDDLLRMTSAPRRRFGT